MKPKEGDVVRITTTEEKVEGILMPRPEILDPNYTVVKLDTGYNIGIENKKIKKTEVIEQYKPKKESKKESKKNPKLPNVTVISTGGTISSKIDYRTGGVSAEYTAEDFVKMCPELLDIANINAKKIMSVMSEDITQDEWEQIAEEVKKELNKEDIGGVIVTQGTDTLHFTTAALSFLLKDLNKPVVFTAAQRSIDRGSSDAFMNLICAVKAAANFDGAEVMTCLHGTPNDDYCLLIRGTKVRKMHTSRRDAFRPINEHPIAKVYKDGKIEITNKKYNKRQKTKVSISNKMARNVAMILVHPGMDPTIIDHYIKNKTKGIVLAATALGHVPTEKNSLMPFIEKAQKANIPIIIATQTIYGRVNQYVYTSLRKLSIELDCIFAEDMLAETAFIKLSWALGQTKDVKKIREIMQTNVCNEINPILDEGAYLL